MSTKILIDTSSGLSKEEADENGFELVGLPFLLDDVEYNDLNLDENIFFEKLANAKRINTSQAPVELVVNKIRELLKEYDEVLYFPITSGLSSSYNTGFLISNADEFKDKVFCIDHKTISVPERRLLLYVKELVDSGYSSRDIKDIVEKNAKNDIWIVVDDFNYLKKGGRVDAITATIGNILNIKPILYSDGGKFSLVKKERSLKNAFDDILSFIDDIVERDYTKFGKEYYLDVAYAKNLELAEEVKKKIHDKFQIPDESIYLGKLSQVVACHTGPDTIGIALYKKIII